MRQIFHILIHPLVGLAVFVGVIWSWHVPGAYAAAVTNDLAHIGQHASFITAATLFWWAIIDPTPIRGKIPYLGRLVIVVYGAVFDVPVGRNADIRGNSRGMSRTSVRTPSGASTR